MPRATRSSTAKAAMPENTMDNGTEPQQLSSPPSTPVAKKEVPTRTKSSSKLKHETPSTLANSGRKRTTTTRVKREDDGDVNDLPHNLGTAIPTPRTGDEEMAEPPKKRSRKVAKTDDAYVKPEAGPADATPKKTPKGKKSGYGVTPGISPYPDYLRPTPDECKEVVRLLEKVHGKVNVPEAVPPPSLDVAGCGEVPSVLDALIRTRLSANTTNKNSSAAFRGLVERFGTIDEGIGKGSVDWDAVRTADNHDVFLAIKHGGLANVKSVSIQKILQMAYEQNQARKTALIEPSEAPAGADAEPESEKKEEIEKASRNIISLDHLHLLDTQEAIDEMVKFPGIGLKTASCVALFCMQRPSFAVDTHVFRLCQYLGWVPKTPKKGQPKVDRNTTYSHCDVRIPDGLKYPLHQLLIKHGKVCPRCRAVTGQNSANWDEGCPIEHLVKRHGAKKGGQSTVARKKAKAAAEEGSEVDGEDSVVLEHEDAEAAGDESELSELESDEE